LEVNRTFQFLRGHAGYRQIFASMSWLTSERLVRMAVGLAVTVWVARYLGPHQFGVLNYAIAIVALLTPLAGLGLDNLVVRDLTRFRGDAPEILGTVFVLKATAALVAALLALSFVLFIDHSRPVTVWLVLLLSVGLLCQSGMVLDLWFQAQVDARPAALSRIAAALVGAVIKVGLIYLRAPMIAFGVVMLLETVLIQVGLLWAYHRHGQHVRRWRAARARVAGLVKEAWPITIAGLAAVVFVGIDQVMLENIKGPQAVGIYSAALRVSEVWYFVPIFLMRSVQPAFVRTYDTDRIAFHQRLQILFALVAAFAVAVALPVTFIATPAVRLLFGPDYAGSAPVLAIHIWTGLFIALGAVRGMWAVIGGHVRFLMVSIGSGAIANIVLNLILIPKHGAVGAAVATIISYAWSGVLSGILYRAAWPILVQQLRGMLMFDLAGFRRHVG
jgi:PST family polysaccharide transporter